MISITYITLAIILAFTLIILGRNLTEIDNEWYCNIIEIDNNTMIAKTKCVIDCKSYVIDVPLSKPLPSLMVGESVVIDKDETLCKVFNFNTGNVTRMIDLEVRSLRRENKYSYDVFLRYYCTLLMNLNIRTTLSHLRYDTRYLDGNPAEVRLILLASYGVERIVELYRKP